MAEFKLTFNADGLGRCLYSEAFPLQLLGRLSVVRATSIEFDEKSQKWEVRDPSQRIQFRSDSREECLEWERMNLSEV